MGSRREDSNDSMALLGIGRENRESLRPLAPMLHQSYCSRGGFDALSHHLKAGMLQPVR